MKKQTNNRIGMERKISLYFLRISGVFSLLSASAFNQKTAEVYVRENKLSHWFISSIRFTFLSINFNNLNSTNTFQVCHNYAILSTSLIKLCFKYHSHGFLWLSYLVKNFLFLTRFNFFLLSLLNVHNGLLFINWRFILRGKQK